MTQLSTKILWLFVAALGAICFGYLALQKWRKCISDLFGGCCCMYLYDRI